MIQML